MEPVTGDNVVNIQFIRALTQNCEECEKSGLAYYLGLSKVTASMTELLYNLNYTRVGRLFRKYDRAKSCCQRIHTRLAIKDFKLSKNDKQVYKRFLNFLRGKYPLEKTKPEEEKKEKKPTSEAKSIRDQVN